MANKKLDQNELKQITDIQTRMDAVKTELGSLALAEIDLSNRRTKVEEYLVDTQSLETKLVADLENKYGKGTIDLNTNEFIPSPESIAPAKPVKKVKTTSTPTVE
jgi:hypothetical protein|tara:strand:- start:17257 stop:17571 length:315 start_codon:yes stop_codon:yes gene_type:complete